MNPKIDKELVAVDISKHSLEVKSHSMKQSYTNDSQGIAELLETLGSMEHPLVIYEATGGYERLLQDSLSTADIAQQMVPPSRVRAFAQSEGIKAKTDPIDAAVILRFAEEKRFRPYRPRSAEHQELIGLMNRRAQLTSFLTQEKTRVQNSRQSILPLIEEMILIIESQIQKTEMAIRAVIRRHTKLKEAYKALIEIKGVGEVTVWSVLAYLAEITELKRNQLVALVGVAPFNKDSGTINKRRSIQGGRSKVRKALYMAAQSAAVWNPVVRPYVQGLRDRGKPYKCAMVAAMRKLIIHMQSKLKNLKISLA